MAGKPKRGSGVVAQLPEALREAQRGGVSWYALAKVTGVSADRISRLARGERGVGLGVFARLCSALGLRLARDPDVPKRRKL
jgi:hypothetical protein